MSDAGVRDSMARAFNPAGAAYRIAAKHVLAPLAEAAPPGKKGKALGSLLDPERFEQATKENDAEPAGK